MKSWIDNDDEKTFISTYIINGLSFTLLPAGASADALETKVEIKVVNNGMILNRRTLVPVRVISEELGSDVEWSPKNRTVTVTDGENKIRVFISLKKRDVKHPSLNFCNNNSEWSNSLLSSRSVGSH